MRRLIVLPLLILVVAAGQGCDTTSEHASSNMQKGDHFFEVGDYEVAEYYYEKIPTDSPLYPQAEKKLQQIARLRAERMAAPQAQSADVGDLQISNHSFTVDNVGVPTHKLFIRNTGGRTVSAIDLEFSYSNEEGKVVDVLESTVRTQLTPGSQQLFKDIVPGLVHSRFTTSSVRIASAKFQD